MDQLAWWLLLVAGGTLLALPVARLLLARVGVVREPVGSKWRRSAVIASLASIGIGVLCALGTDGLWILAGVKLAAWGLLGLAVALTAPVAPAAGRAHAGASLGILIALLALLFLPYFGNTRSRAYQRAVTSDIRNAASELLLTPDVDPAAPPPIEASPGVTVTRVRRDGGWRLSATHATEPIRCTADVDDGAATPRVDCQGVTDPNGWTLGRLGVGYLGGVLVALALSALRRGTPAHGNRMRSGRPSAAGIMTSGTEAKLDSKPGGGA